MNISCGSLEAEAAVEVPGGVRVRAGFESQLGFRQEEKKEKAPPGQGVPGQVVESGGRAEQRVMPGVLGVGMGACLQVT